MRVRFVTGNAGKLREAREALAAYGFTVEGAPVATVEPQADQLETVARAKAEGARGKVEPPYFVEDAGLFVDALRGFPGVYSAYVYGTVGWQGLLALLEEEAGRTAVFRAAVALVDGPAPPRVFTGECRGRIARTPAGSGGFGFDPVFVPEGETRTFAELAQVEKSRLSHRGRALEALGHALAAGTVRRKSGREAGRKRPTS